MRDLLDATPAGGWVKANTGLYSDAWATGSVALPGQSHTNPGSIVQAWSSMTWDSTRQNMMLWGGGHANYMGNEMYLWQGADGTWTRGSVASRIEYVAAPDGDTRRRLVVDDAAPQSAHTYEGNMYLPVNDMFVTFGGPVYNTGGPFQVRDGGGNLVTAGPWMWDPRKADANKVGGTTGSGYDPTTIGGEMWTNRQGQWTGLDVSYGPFINNASAYREENGHDVIYITMKTTPSNWPLLYRYTFGDVRAGELDQWELVGTSRNAPSTTSTATIDNLNNLFVHTAVHPNTTFDLNVWDLSQSGAGNRDVAIDLVLADGTDFRANTSFGIEYADVDGGLWMWDGKDRGTLYRTEAAFNPDGSVASQWVVERMTSTTAEQPGGNFVGGVLGKWQYVEELGAFLALNEYNSIAKDAEVWLYKPQVTAVPEPAALWMLAGGLAFVSLYRRRVQRQQA